MERIINLLQGCVKLEAKGAFPENLLNFCAKQGVEMWDISPVEDYSLSFTIHSRDLKRVEDLAKRAMCTLEPKRKRGAPYMLRRLKKRYMLLAGAVACVLALAWSSLYIWEFEVTGNETLSSVEILHVLDECGVGIGSFWPTFTSDNIRSEALIKLPELSWLTVNVHGSRAEVIVRERIPKPDIVDEGRPTNVVATKSGLITEMNVLRGTAVLEKGYTVLKGDVMVSGAVESSFAGGYAVHAMAKVTARTWYELTAAMPLTEYTKVYTGGDSTRYSLLFGDKRINFYHNSGTEGYNCDKIESESRLGIDGIFALPLGIIKETSREYRIAQVPLNAETVRPELEAELDAYLRAEIGESGEVVTSAFSASEKDGYIYVTLRAECIEEIWKIRDMTEDELWQLEEKKAP